MCVCVCVCVCMRIPFFRVTETVVLGNYNAYLHEYVRDFYQKKKE